MAISIQEYRAMRTGNQPGAQSAKGKKANPEYQYQAEFVRQMAIEYPDVMVFSDTAAHIKKTAIQQKRANKLSTGVKWPDVFVAQPSGEYHGLYLEFKAESPFKKDGVSLKSNEHVEAQNKCLEMLEKRGYCARFVWPSDENDAMLITRKYLNGYQ